MLSEFQKLAVQRGINNLFNQSYFDICSLRSICKLVEVPFGGKVRESFSLYHCIDYCDMSRQEIEALKNEVITLLQGHHSVDSNEVIGELVGEEVVVENKPNRLARMLCLK